MKFSFDRYYKIGFPLILICFLCSCKKFLSIPAPRTDLIRSSVFTNDATAIAAQSAIYAQMPNNFSLNVSEYLGFSSDESVAPGSGSGFYNNTITSDNSQLLFFIWTPFYQFIYESNAVLEGIENSSGVSNVVKKQLTGEAKFTRAFCYFYLVNLFSDIPLLTTTDYATNALASRAPVADIYQQIKSDLSQARGLLSKNYLGGDLKTNSVDRVRPTSYVASALLARVCLFQKQYDSAYFYANEVISNPIFELDSLQYVFTKNSKAAIWQFDRGYNTNEASRYLLLAPKPFIMSLSPYLMETFESGDRRMQEWTITYKDDGTFYSYPYKYKNNMLLPPVTELVIALRLSEQYLIRAEAEAYGAGGGLSDAIKDLNKIRHRASLPDYDGPVNKDTILNAILHERQVEFFSEWGHRWLDLKRTGKVDEVMGKVTPEKSANAWDTDQQWYPIPQTERERNPNLTQNNGYN